jgi:trimethylamine--corrinoid protein Co-methyltransferase
MHEGLMKRAFEMNITGIDKRGIFSDKLQDFSGIRYKPLNNMDISSIHEISMRVFSEIGIKVKNKEAFELFAMMAKSVDSKNSIVKLDPDTVMELISTAPQVITLYGQRPENTLHVGEQSVYAGTGGTALYVMDPGKNDRRDATLQDLKNIARVVDEMKNIDFFMLPVLPSDIPDEFIDVNRFGTALCYQGKHVTGGVYTVEGIREVIKMAELIAGSAQALQEKPLISFVTCCGISPFVLDDHYSKLTLEVVRAGIPVITPAEPLCGSTAPITLAGNLVVQNVDTLTGIMLTQLASPGAPVFYGCISSISDLKDLKYLSGAVEMGLMNAAASQLARHYNLPIYATAGMSDSKTLDAQAGFESSITNLLVALAGGNYIHDAAGLLEFCLTASLEKYVIDDEILGMTKRALKGIEITPDTLAFDIMKKIGPGGHFVSSQHTRKFMRKEQFLPKISDRSTRKEWLSKGSPDTRQKAMQRVKEILGIPSLPVPSSEVMERIRSEIKGVNKKVI